jgi:hypothetical protein
MRLESSFRRSLFVNRDGTARTALDDTRVSATASATAQRAAAAAAVVGATLVPLPLQIVSAAQPRGHHPHAIRSSVAIRTPIGTAYGPVALPRICPSSLSTTADGTDSHARGWMTPPRGTSRASRDVGEVVMLLRTTVHVAYCDGQCTELPVAVRTEH